MNLACISSLPSCLSKALSLHTFLSQPPTMSPLSLPLPHSLHSLPQPTPTLINPPHIAPPTSPPPQNSFFHHTCPSHYHQPPSLTTSRIHTAPFRYHHPHLLSHYPFHKQKHPFAVRTSRVSITPSPSCGKSFLTLTLSLCATPEASSSP